MATAQDSTSVTVSQLDVNNQESGATVNVIGNNANLFDQATQTDQPPGPFPESPSGPAPEVDGSSGVK